jgi:hypothetical protein
MNVYLFVFCVLIAGILRGKWEHDPKKKGAIPELDKYSPKEDGNKVTEAFDPAVFLSFLSQHISFVEFHIMVNEFAPKVAEFANESIGGSVPRKELEAAELNKTYSPLIGQIIFVVSQYGEKDEKTKVSKFQDKINIRLEDKQGVIEIIVLLPGAGLDGGSRRLLLAYLNSQNNELDIRELHPGHWIKYIADLVTKAEDIIKKREEEERYQKEKDKYFAPIDDSKFFK